MLRLWAQPPAELAYPDVYFTPQYGRAELAAGDEWKTVVSEDGSWQVPLVVRQLPQGAVDASSPYGYAGIYASEALRSEHREALWAETKELLRAQGVVSLFIRDSPLVSTYTPPDDDLVPVVRDHPTVVAELGPEDEMWASIQGRARTAVRKARKSGLHAEVGPVTRDALLQAGEFRRLYDATMDRVGAADNYFFGDGYYQALAEGLGDALLMCIVRAEGGDAVAACLVMCHGHLAHYHLSGSTPDGARAGANAMLLWEVMAHVAQTGARTLMLGGATGAGSSLLRFKESFGTAIMSFDASGVIIDDVRYRDAVRERCAGTAVTPEQLVAGGFFPAYRGVP